MIDFHKEIPKALTILDCYYEMAINENTRIPCITYMERDNSATHIGDTLEYSRVSYTIKIWGYLVSDLQNYAAQVDIAMRKLGFKRISSGELYDNQTGLIQKIMGYEALAMEEL